MAGLRRLWMPLAVTTVVAALVLDLWKPTEPIGIDFHTYEAAARVGLQHGWSHIYDQSLVAAEQQDLVPGQRTQPFISPPTTAWLAALLAPLPYWPSYYVWAVFTLAAFALALAWASPHQGLVRWLGAGAAIAPWWVLHAVHVGQVVPLVAAGVVVAWRLLRERHEPAAGGALVMTALKPNTAFVVPFALLFAGRYRAFLVWAAAGGAIAVIALATMGSTGTSNYIHQLAGPLPGGADNLTLEGALGVSGAGALAVRVLIIGATLATAIRLRRSPGLVIAAGVLASLLVAPYLHGSDLCLLSAAAWIVWQERKELAWRAPLAVGWLIASPLVASSGIGLGLNRWPLVELLMLAALAFDAWRPWRNEPALTREAEVGEPATA